MSDEIIILVYSSDAARNVPTPPNRSQLTTHCSLSNIFTFAPLISHGIKMNKNRLI